MQCSPFNTVCLVTMFVASVEASAQMTTPISVSSTGAQANNDSHAPSISANRRYVAFRSDATNLVPGDTNGFYDVFVHDRQTDETTRVSLSSSGEQGTGDSAEPSISEDGRYLAFSSYANNLVPDDTGPWLDVFVRDTQSNQTTRVNISTNGAQADGGGSNPSISADGRYVAFNSGATNLVPGDTNGLSDVFVHDRETGQTTRVSLSSSREQGNNTSYYPYISSDGRYVGFSSSASNLVPGDNNAYSDVFVHDRQTGQTTRVSISTSGEEGEHSSSYPSPISADGRYVAFGSTASNLVPDDTNGTQDVFVHDSQTGQTTRESVSSSGEQGSEGGANPSISGDGRFVAFYSNSSNLIPGDTNETYDILMRDRQAATTFRVSVSSTGGQANGASSTPSISADGRYVAFSSNANNLIAGDTNGWEDIFVHGLCPGNINGDATVNVNDLLLVIALWGPCSNPVCYFADIAPPGGDGTVNVVDLLAVINGWGPCP